MFSFCLVILSAFVAARGDRTNINDILDHIMEEVNNQQRLTGTTSAPFPEIPLSPEVKYSNAVFLGVDSIHRTGDCWQEVEGTDYSYDIHYGFRLMAVMLPHLEVYRTNMSGYASVGDNSVHLAYTMHLRDEECNVTLEDLRVERMGKVEFRASRPEYDGSNLDGYFKLVVMPSLNWIVDSSFDKIEASLQALCKLKDYQHGTRLNDLVMELFHN